MSSQPTSAHSDQAPGLIGELVAPVSFRSILFPETDIDPDIDSQQAPEFFGDLNLDQIVESVTAGRDEYSLKSFFYAPLKDVQTVNYRHDIFRDLEDQTLVIFIQSFAGDMRRMRAALAEADKLDYKYQKQRWFLDAVEIYCGAVSRLNENLMRAKIGSRGLNALNGYLASYVHSGDFGALVSDTANLKRDLAGIRYSLHISGKRITVSQYGSEPDYSADVLQTFEKFRQGAPRQYRFEYRDTQDMNHVEAAILDFVARLFPDAFSSLDAYCSRYSEYLNRTIVRFDREVQFYLACLDHVNQFKQSGLSFCYPEVTDQTKDVFGNGVFDLALANRLRAKKSIAVPNDFYLQDQERIFVVSGPNQGGKTTFARTFGQLHYLASIGCPVPGTESRLFLFDKLFTHFEKEEDIRNLRGKLEDDLRRIHQILRCATPNSILIMNESFLATTSSDALFLSKEIMRRIVHLDMLCVSVTFLDELASFDKATVSMVSTVHPEDPALRTFKVVRKPADGLAYAIAIAQKYRLTEDAVKERIARNPKGRVTQ